MKRKDFLSSKRAKSFCVLAIFALVQFHSACQSAENYNTANSNTSNEDLVIPTSTVNLAKPLELSKRPEDVALCRKINEQIDTSEFANARWGVIALSLKDGRVACARDAQKLFNPASIEKLLTSVVALDKLGEDFRWKTSVVAQNKIEADGTLAGDVILFGGGAPDFDSEKIEQLVAALKAKNLRRITGKIIGDESFFKGDTIGDGWTWNELQWYYGAEASALTVNDNLVRIRLANGRPISSPPNDYVKLDGEVAPANGEIESIGVKRGLADNHIHVWGSGSNLDARVAISNPALWAAKIFKESLIKNVIAVDGEAGSSDWKTQPQVSVGTIELASIQSAPLSEIVRKMNKDSVNLYAELILRTLGKKYGDSAPDENPKLQKVRGDDSAGTAVIKKWLQEHNIATDEIAIHDGSGLSRLDFVSPEVFARALVFASQSKGFGVFKNSLPLAGVDGTLKGRFQNLSGRIAAKTGSSTYVNSLAGYARSTNDEVFAFAIIVNNETQKADSVSLIDAIVSNLAK